MMIPALGVNLQRKNNLKTQQNKQTVKAHSQPTQDSVSFGWFGIKPKSQYFSSAEEKIGLLSDFLGVKLEKYFAHDDALISKKSFNILTAVRIKNEALTPLTQRQQALKFKNDYKPGRLGDFINEAYEVNILSSLDNMQVVPRKTPTAKIVFDSKHNYENIVPVSLFSKETAEALNKRFADVDSFSTISGKQGFKVNIKRENGSISALAILKTGKVGTFDFQKIIPAEI